MVGPWPLAPHHDHYNIYTSCTTNATGSEPGCYKAKGILPLINNEMLKKVFKMKDVEILEVEEICKFKEFEKMKIIQ